MPSTGKKRCTCGQIVTKSRLKQHKKSRMHIQQKTLTMMSRAGYRFVYESALVNFLDKNPHIKFKKVPMKYWYFAPKEIIEAHQMFVKYKDTTYRGLSYHEFMEGVFAK